jgi:hypothetical protein
MPRPAKETTAWVATKIQDMSDVKDTEVTSDNTIRIFRKQQRTFDAGVIAIAKVTGSSVESLLDKYPSVEVVINIPKESIWTGEAIATVAERGVSFGGLRDLMSMINSQIEEVGQYVRTEFAFVERGLNQHSRVESFERVFDRVYLVKRRALPPMRFVMLNEYELTGDHIRTAFDRYRTFDVVLLNNPNGKPTQSAFQVAEGMGVEILKWGEFLGRLNRK